MSLIATTHIDQNLKRYLEMEAVLNAFFAAFDYCLCECIRPAMQRMGNRPVAACCTRKYYDIDHPDHPAFERLTLERDRRFGKPSGHGAGQSVSPCEYHNPHRGCLLSSHKSPICLAFVCPQGITCLRSRYGIYGYDYLGVYYALEWILTGDLPKKEYLEFRKSILEMTEIITREKCARQHLQRQTWRKELY